MSSTGQFRIEKDTLGEVKVPAYAYYGSQTQRAADNFQISGITLPRSFIRAQGIIKASAAQANMKLGELPDNIGRVIVQAAEEVIEGKWDHQFIVDVYQAGAGTSQNMNVNEIIGNRATELLGSSLDPSANDFRVHPHNHVNMSQSTNDTFPSALHIATVENISEQLLPAIERLVKELNVKSEEFNSIIKSGRTHLHDAVPMKLGQEFAGYTDTIRFVYENIKASLDPFYEIGLGGNAIGTVINTHPDYPQTVIQEINSRINYPFRQPVEMFSFMQNRNAALRMMSVLKELAVHLIKITSDLRLLSSGPRTGLAEISLPPVQPGSTIMPGKVNPAILEMVHMICCRIIGNEAAMAAAGTAGQLEINVMMPFMAYSLLESIELLSNGIHTLVSKCVYGIEAKEENCRNWMMSSLSFVTGLSPSMGYDMASQIGMQADEQNKTIKEVLEELGLYSQEAAEALDPKKFV